MEDRQNDMFQSHRIRFEVRPLKLRAGIVGCTCALENFPHTLLCPNRALSLEGGGQLDMTLQICLVRPNNAL